MCISHADHSIDRLTLTLTFDLIFIDGRGIVMDYPCAKFGNFTFSRFGFTVRTDRQTDRQRRMVAILTRLVMKQQRGLMVLLMPLMIGG